ncbi:MAG: hypothetical protein MUC91_10810 [Verrucomicrobia bacterium]|nr:hypothetical protein [Verrucomicrobiota bacterium]
MRLLVLTHAFPPSTHANAKRPHYLVRGFLDEGWEVDVITSTLGVHRGDAETLSHPRLRITRFDEPADALRRKLSSWPRLMRWTGLAMAGLLWPDERVLWSRRALSAVQSAGNYDRTLVFVRPASLLLAARRGLIQPTWAFDFQEPILLT